MADTGVIIVCSVLGVGSLICGIVTLRLSSVSHVLTHLTLIAILVESQETS